MSNLLKNIGLFIGGCLLSLPIALMLVVGNGNMGQEDWAPAFSAGVIGFYILFALVPAVAMIL